MASSPTHDLTLGSQVESGTVHDHEVQKLGKYLHALQKERGKVEAFKRELPLCLHLLDEAIESTKQRVMEDQCSPTTSLQTSERSKGTPVLENFMPLKRRWENQQKVSKSGHSSDDCEQHHQVVLGRPAWTGEAQLWTQQSTDHEGSRGTKRNVEFGEAKTLPMASSRLHLSGKHRQGGAFVPFIRERHSPESAPPADDVRITSPANKKTAESFRGHVDTNVQVVRAYHHGSSSMAVNQSQGQSRTVVNQPQRKTRRCWSPELHRRFVSALHQLGGSQVATPKQIRELMKVDSLTNDEVKSHLQKYRLHTRRPSPSPSSGTTSAQAPQLVVLGWMRPDQFQAAVGAAAASQASTGGGVCDGGPPPPLVVAHKCVPPQSTEQQQQPSPPPEQQVEPSPKHASAAISTSHSSLPGPSSVTGGSPNSSSNSYMEEADHGMVMHERKSGRHLDPDMKEPQLLQLQPAIESKGSTTSLVDIGINSLRKTKAAA